jgi:hypothetical protein
MVQHPRRQPSSRIGVVLQICMPLCENSVSLDYQGGFVYVDIRSTILFSASSFLFKEVKTLL